ncbi:hypothetical protein ABZ753_21730 [Streptomyces griseoincarnatus]
MTAPWCREEAERLLGPDVMKRIRELAAEAPPLRPEQREQVRAVFASARASRVPVPPAAEAA